MMERAIWRSVVAVGLELGLAGCEAQASESYLGEPLLQVSGQAIVNSPTSGLPIKPALCFSGNTQHKGEHFDGSFIPAEVMDHFRDVPNNLADEFRQNLTIQEVESVGEFPTDFNIAVYVPPPDSAIHSFTEKEPRAATGYFCAVRADHPTVVEAAYYTVDSDCDPSKEDESCHRRNLWATRETERYYYESYECPDAKAELDACLLTTSGDLSVKREAYEYVVGGDDSGVVYLKERAPADSYLAWIYNNRKSISPGFHVYKKDASYDTEEYSKCFTEANFRSIAALSGAEYVPGEFPKFTKEQAKKYLDTPDEEKRQNLIDTTIQTCDAPDMHEVSRDESLSIVINPEVKTGPVP